MDATPAPDPGLLPTPGHLPAEPAPQAAAAEPVPPTTGRLRALAEILACSGVPTQTVAGLLVAGVGRALFGVGPQLTLTSLGLLIALDSLALIGLVCFFLRAGGERPTAVLFGRRRAVGEVSLGLLMLPAVFAVTITTALLIGRFAPWLRTVDNQFAAMVKTPLDAAMLAGIAVLGAGIREEVQRAFILHRFEQHLGGAMTGLVVYSLLFGLMHQSMQGNEVVVITGLLGALWGLLYLWRRSIVAPMVSHGSFNLIEALLILHR